MGFDSGWCPREERLLGNEGNGGDEKLEDDVLNIMKEKLGGLAFASVALERLCFLHDEMKRSFRSIQRAFRASCLERVGGMAQMTIIDHCR